MSPDNYNFPHDLSQLISGILSEVEQTNTAEEKTLDQQCFYQGGITDDITSATNIYSSCNIASNVTENNGASCKAILTQILTLEENIEHFGKLVQIQENEVNLLSGKVGSCSLSLEGIDGNYAVDSGLECHKNSVFQFILTHLQTSSSNNVIRWTHQAKGHFCILDSQKLANMWGKEKCKENMTKEKLHRSLQYQVRIGKLRNIGKNRYSIMVECNQSKAQKIYENKVSEVFVYENLVKTSAACPNSSNVTESKCNHMGEQETRACQFTHQALEQFNSGSFESTYEQNRKCIKSIISQLVSLRECNHEHGFHINWVNEEVFQNNFLVSPNADQLSNPCFTEEGKFSETYSSLTLSPGNFLDLFSNSFFQIKDLDNQENQDKVIEN